MDKEDFLNVTHSEEIGNLTAALSKAQAEMQKAKKNADNPFLKSKYADLTSVIEASRDALSRNELAILQIPGSSPNGKVYLTTVLAHSSGEWFKGIMEAPNENTKNKVQGLGAVITYLRRYMWGAMIGLSTGEDSDGEGAIGQSSAIAEKWFYRYADGKAVPNDVNARKVFSDYVEAHKGEKPKDSPSLRKWYDKKQNK